MTQKQLPDAREVTVRKARIGTVTERWHNGSWESIDDRGPDNIQRKAVLDLDGQYNGDYRVGAASDPLIVVVGTPDDSHNNVREALLKHNMWLSEFRPILVPHKTDEWKPGFRSLPRGFNRVDLLRELAEKAVVRDMDIRGDADGFSAYLPIE